MLNGLKPYAEYKDVREPWLGAIPAHWETRRNGRLFAHRVETGFPDLPVLEVSIKTGVRIRNLDSAARKQVMSDFGKYKRTCQGDIAYNMMRMWQGAVGVSPVDGLVSPAYVVARPHAGTNTRFFDYLFRTPVYMDEVNNFSRGIVSDRNRLYWDEFKQMPSPFPPPAEQSGIVRFLGAVDRKVNRFIRAKRRLIDVLTEQKQAIITHAVTRGLNPHSPLKPSGIDWLGDLPEHWEVMQLRRLVRRGKRITYGIVQPGEPDPSGRYMVRGQDYSFGWVEPSRIFRVSAEIEEPYRRSRLAAGDLLVTIVGAGVGNVGVVPDWLDGANITQTTARVAIDGALADSGFVAWSLRSAIGKRNVERFVKGAAQPGLNLEHVRIFQIPMPPLEEQVAISISLNRATKIVDRAIADASREIDLIREYRTRLVADVVTGKVDVRAAAAALPDEPPTAAAGADDQPGDDSDHGDVEDGAGDPEDGAAEEVEA
jgi:type I restriction enzyme S subunit